MSNENPENLKNELYKVQLSSIEYLHIISNSEKPLYGMTTEQYIEGVKFHKECFSKIQKISLHMIP